MEKNLYYPVFFIATIWNWKNILKPEKYIIIILKKLVWDDKILLFSYCIMSNHLHLLWQVKGENGTIRSSKAFPGKQFQS